MATDSLIKSATLSNNINNSSIAFQGGADSVAEGGTVTTRTGTIKFTGLNVLAGKKITQIDWYIEYGSYGKSAQKVLTFTSPSHSFTSGVTAYDNNETRTLSFSGEYYPMVINAINGTGTLTWKINNGETETTHETSSGSSSYTENYLGITSSKLYIYYEQGPSFKYYDGTDWKSVEEVKVFDGSQWNSVTTSNYYDGTKWKSING